jgi:hypothetical protein
MLGALLMFIFMVAFTVNITALEGPLGLLIMLACFWLPVALGIRRAWVRARR